MYEVYIVQKYPHITSLGYLHRTPSRLPLYMLPNIFPNEACAHPSKRMSGHRVMVVIEAPMEQRVEIEIL